jgi:hypothetical protein
VQAANTKPTASQWKSRVGRDHIRGEMADVRLDAFEAGWRKLWLVERDVEIISEVSRRLPASQ